MANGYVYTIKSQPRMLDIKAPVVMRVPLRQAFDGQIIGNLRWYICILHMVSTRYSVNNERGNIHGAAPPNRGV